MSFKGVYMEEIKYIVVVQCDIVKERCSGYYCEYAFTNRAGSFDIYKENDNLRFLPITCGGCCGRGVHRKLTNLLRQIKKRENIKKDSITVHFSSCISFESFHGPPCPHKEYLETLVHKKLGMKIIHGTRINELTEKRREQGVYQKRTC